MNQTMKRILKNFKIAVLKKFSKEIIRMTLYGSHARGTPQQDSDIDILIVTKHDDWRIGDKIGNVAYTVSLETGSDISAKVMSQEHYDYLRRLKAPFFQNILKEGITL